MESVLLTLFYLKQCDTYLNFFTNIAIFLHELNVHMCKRL